MQIVDAAGVEQVALVRGLFEEYWASFGFTPCFQNFAGELAALPGDYAPPGGRLALALVDGRPAGCVALRRFDGQRGELKRLFVRRQLLEWAIAGARAAGYSELVCDTMPVMAEALAMYERAGFERSAAYSGHPAPGAIFLRLALPT
jgi:hypothetical protein